MRSPTYGAVSIQEVAKILNDYYKQNKHFGSQFQITIGTDSQNFSDTKVVVVIAILACIFLMGDSPKKSVETMLGDLKSGNYSQTVLSDLSEEDFDEEAQKLLFDKLEWKVQNVKEEGDTATVEVEITNKDFKTIIANYMQKVIKIAFSGESISEEEMTNYLIEELNNNEIEMVTSNQTIILKKQDGKWEVSEENDFVNILLPGFNEAISAFN